MRKIDFKKSIFRRSFAMFFRDFWDFISKSRIFVTLGGKNRAFSLRVGAGLANFGPNGQKLAGAACPWRVGRQNWLRKSSVYENYFFIIFINYENLEFSGFSILKIPEIFKN